MATNLREFFSSISENIELGEDFDINQIPEVELPEQFNNNFHQNFLTPLSAKNNDTIRNHFKGQYLSTVDSRLKASFLANGGTEELFNELKSEQPDSMKLIDVVTAKMGELISKPNATTGNKEFEAYKTETAKQINSLMEENAQWEDKLKSAVNEKNSEWSSKLKNSMITSKLNAKSFNDSIGKEDAVYLTMKKVNDSPYILGLDENLQEKVYNKENPEMEAIVDGKNVDWGFVLDKYSYDYTKKNDQQQAPAPKVVVAPAKTTISDEDGRYIVGHPNYGK
jgi:hypothetical protein